MKNAEAREGASFLSTALAHPRFELMPVEGAERQTSYLPAGASVTVTCSPSRGLESTLRLAEELSQKGFRAVPHVSARLVRDESRLEEIVRRLNERGVSEIFVVGGDVKEPEGEFSSTLELLRAMDRLGHGFEEIGVAGYPEGHPFISDEALWRALSEKRRFATYVVTQMCFDAGKILGWISRLRKHGIRLPVYAGVPGVVEWHRLLRIALKIGVGDSARFLTKTGGALKMLSRPSYRPDDLVENLAPYVGDPGYSIRGLHFYTFNQIQELESWRRPLLEPAEEAAP